MNKVRLGIIGGGTIGQIHLRAVQTLPEIEVVGICSRSGSKRSELAATFGVATFPDHSSLIKQTQPDYVVICTPHLTHAPIAVDVMKQGVHALVEKPLAVRPTEVESAIRCAQKHRVTFGVNFQMRLRPLHQKLIALIQNGYVGQVRRVTLISTQWFRSMAYYRSNNWRATWQGEGGGVLTNQAPHDLDLLLHAVGMPTSVYADLDTIGHDIEVEDSFSALLRWGNNAFGSIQITTADAPGRYLFEIAGTRGTLTLEPGRLQATSLAEDADTYSRTTSEPMSAPAIAATTSYEIADTQNRYALAHRNFIAAFQSGQPLMCSAQSAKAEVDLAAAMLISGIKREPVELPVAPEAFDFVFDLLAEHRSLAAVRSIFQSDKIASETCQR